MIKILEYLIVRRGVWAAKGRTGFLWTYRLFFDFRSISIVITYPQAVPFRPYFRPALPWPPPDENTPRTGWRNFFELWALILVNWWSMCIRCTLKSLLLAYGFLSQTASVIMPYPQFNHLLYWYWQTVDLLTSSGPEDLYVFHNHPYCTSFNVTSLLCVEVPRDSSLQCSNKQSQQTRLCHM